ncbi:MAG: hypothetical protein WDN28_29950 [Chthoniobacter sp.]
MEKVPVSAMRAGTAEVRTLNVHVEIGIQLEPIHRLIVAPRLEPVADTETDDRPVIQRVDGVELREVDRRRLGRRDEAVELINLIRGLVGVHERGVHVGLDNVPKAIEAPRARLHAFIRPGKFE